MVVSPEVIIGILGGAIIGALILFVFSRARVKNAPEALSLLQNQLNEIARTLDQRLGESTRAIQSHFGTNTEIIRDVTERPETIECGSNILSGVDPKCILDAVKLVTEKSCDWEAPWEYLVPCVSDTAMKIITGYLKEI